MRVLQINAVYGAGSTGAIVKDIHKLSVENGIESYVAYSVTNEQKSEIVGGYQIGGILEKKLHAVLSRINGKQAYFSKLSTKKLLCYIDEIKPDIVHLHNLHSNYINLNMLLKYLAEKKISTVVTLHDCWFFTGGCFHYTNAKCDRWQKECGSCPKKMDDVPSYFLDCSKMILRDRKRYFGAIEDLTVVGVSQWITQEAGKTFFKNNRLLNITNGLDMELFVHTPSDLKRELGLDDKFVLIGTAERWLLPEAKGDLEFFASNLPDDCALVIFGCRGKQKELLPKGVLGIDYVYDRKEMVKIYSMADVFVNCTYGDSLPFVNMESQACGTPTVTYCVTGAKETVDNINSFSVETGNSAELLQKALGIKKYGKKHYSQGCREFVYDRFNKQQSYKNYIDLYKTIIADKSINK